MATQVTYLLIFCIISLTLFACTNETSNQKLFEKADKIEKMNIGSEKESDRTKSAGKDKDEKGIGPITVVKIGPINANSADHGKELFKTKCSTCHKVDERFLGPALKGVTQRRRPEWIMNMILNPIEMTQKDKTAQGLLNEYATQMTFQNVTQDEAREILEYFRQNDSEGRK